MKGVTMTDKKTCSKCNREFPATTEYFGRNKRGKDGLQAWCKACFRSYRDDRQQYFAEYGREYYEANKGYFSQRGREWRASHPGYQREWRGTNPDYQRKRQRDNPIRYRLYRQNRDARKLALRNDFTPEQQRIALEYFGYVCAACGRPFSDLFGERTLALDHWIPLASPDCPGTTATNMIPLCHGVDGCNTTKQDRDPKEWLISRFGKRKAREILARVEAYFAEALALAEAEAV